MWNFPTPRLVVTLPLSRILLATIDLEHLYLEWYGTLKNNLSSIPEVANIAGSWVHKSLNTTITRPSVHI